MPKVEPFERYSEEYEDWFERNRFAYLSELEAIRVMLPRDRGLKALEVGVGSARFAEPLGIKLGVEPSARMAEMARKRGVEVLEGAAEELPFPEDFFDLLLMVTTICFVDDPEKALREAYRVLRPRRLIVIGFVDRESPLGRLYQKKKERSRFYRVATFFSADELVSLLKRIGFRNIGAVQTIFSPLEELKDVEPVKEGYGEGGFVVLRGEK